MQLKLALFDFCPYCQRVRILLEHYALSHELAWIDPASPPDWFTSASPDGRVPVLMADDTPILESVVIGELVDEIGGGHMLPRDPIPRAQVRAWVEAVSGCQSGFGAMVRAGDDAAYRSALEQLHVDLARIDQAMSDVGPYFSGDALCMVDVVLAPLLTRMRVLQSALPCFPEDRPKLQRLAEELALLPEVDRSVDSDPAGVFSSMVAHLNPQGYVAAHWSR